MSLEMIRMRLDNTSNTHYKDVISFVNDVRQIFKNVYLFYRVCLYFRLIIIIV